MVKTGWKRVQPAYAVLLTMSTNPAFSALILGPTDRLTHQHVNGRLRHGCRRSGLGSTVIAPLSQLVMGARERFCAYSLSSSSPVIRVRRPADYRSREALPARRGVPIKRLT
jgi:hypothetical protein